MVWVSLACIATLVSLLLLLHRREWVLLATPSRINLLLLLRRLHELRLERTTIVRIRLCARLPLRWRLLLVYGQVLCRWLYLHLLLQMPRVLLLFATWTTEVDTA